GRAMPAVTPRSTVAMSSPSLRYVQSASAIACSSLRRRGRPPVVEVLDGLRGRVEHRGARRDGRPRPGVALVAAPLVLDVLARLAVADPRRSGDVGPLARVGDVAPPRLALLGGEPVEARGDELRGRKVVEVDDVGPAALELLVALERAVEEREHHDHVVDGVEHLEPPLEVLPCLLGRGAEARDLLEARHRRERPVLGLAGQRPRILEAGVEDRHQSSSPVSPFTSVTVRSTGNSRTLRRTSAGRPLSVRSRRASPIFRTPGVSRLKLKMSLQAISPTGLPSASLMLNPKSTSGFGVPSGSFTRKYVARFARTRSRTSFAAKPWRRKMRAATSTVL